MPVNFQYTSGTFCLDINFLNKYTTIINQELCLLYILRNEIRNKLFCHCSNKLPKYSFKAHISLFLSHKTNLPELYFIKYGSLFY